MKWFFVFLFVSGMPPLFAASAEGMLSRQELIERVTAHGVPRRGIERLLEFQDRHLGAEFVLDVYQCAGLDPADLRHCSERHRIYKTQTLVLKAHRYAVYIDFKQPSQLKRLYLIDLFSGETEAHLVAHGSGSGKAPEAQRFSNRRDSRMTSLGIYITGGTYMSRNHGVVLRLHGLERSNNRAYERDIVFHGAKYAQQRFIGKINPKTRKPYERLGESHGCPAVDPAFASRAIPLLLGGALILHDHEDLLDQALSGEEVSLSPEITAEVADDP